MNRFYDYAGHVITVKYDHVEKAYIGTVIEQKVHKETQHDYVLWDVFFHETGSSMAYVHNASKCFMEDPVTGIFYINGCTCINSLITNDKKYIV